MNGEHPGGRRIVVGVDGSRSAVDAVRWAAAEARRRRAGLRIVEAFGWMPVQEDEDRSFVGPSYHEVLAAAARTRLASAAAAAAEVAPDVPVETALMGDYPIPRLVAESRSAELVVVGDRGLAGITGMMVASVGAGLAAHAACPTVVVRGAEPGGPIPTEGPVVVGIDGSPLSEAAVAFAFEAASARQVGLVAVHTWRDDRVDEAVSMIVDRGAVEAHEHQLLAERLAGWSAKYPDVAVRRVVRMDRPAHALRELSLGSQLLVVGSRGRGGLVGTLLGSVGLTLLHHASCPVVVVRPDPGR